MVRGAVGARITIGPQSGALPLSALSVVTNLANSAFYARSFAARDMRCHLAHCSHTLSVWLSALSLDAVSPARVAG